jgi:hypothetical protein
VNPVWAAVITAAAAGIAIAALLTVRRRAPEGSYFADGDRAAGFFGVLATGFSVLLGLIVFLAFSSFDESRAGAEAEALLVRQQFETAQFLPVAVRRPLGDELVCYGRTVVHEEWPDLESGRQAELVNPWTLVQFRTLRAANPRTAAEQSAYDKWLDLTADREEARRNRIHGALGLVPGPLWVVLFFISAVIFVYMLFFADSGERRITQAMMIGSVIAVITATLLLIAFLNDPFRSGYGGLRPDAMERTLRILDEERSAFGASAALPCDANGKPA